MIEDYFDSPLSKEYNSVMNSMRPKINNKQEFIIAMSSFINASIDSIRP